MIIAEPLQGGIINLVVKDQEGSEVHFKVRYGVRGEAHRGAAALDAEQELRLGTHGETRWRDW